MAAAAAHPPAAGPLALLFAALGPPFGGRAEPLEEAAIAQLVERARAGDAGARQTLYEQFAGRVFRTLRGMLHADADAEDATQDAMLAVLTSLHRYTPRPGASFAAWVAAIAVNTARRRFRRRRPELTATGELPDLPAEASDPAGDLDRARQRRALLVALAELPGREREIVSLRYGADLDASEIAVAIGAQPAAVRKTLERARTRLGARIDALLNPGRGTP
jgi:RNA polymerase sigma-70 factor (ECF subfamily)